MSFLSDLFGGSEQVSSYVPANSAHADEAQELSIALAKNMSSKGNQMFDHYKDIFMPYEAAVTNANTAMLNPSKDLNLANIRAQIDTLPYRTKVEKASADDYINDTVRENQVQDTQAHATQVGLRDYMYETEKNRDVNNRQREMFWKQADEFTADLEANKGLKQDQRDAMTAGIADYMADLTRNKSTKDLQGEAFDAQLKDTISDIAKNAGLKDTQRDALDVSLQDYMSDVVKNNKVEDWQRKAEIVGREDYIRDTQRNRGVKDVQREAATKGMQEYIANFDRNREVEDLQRAASGVGLRDYMSDVQRNAGLKDAQGNALRAGFDKYAGDIAANRGLEAKQRGAAGASIDEYTRDLNQNRGLKDLQRSVTATELGEYGRDQVENRALKDSQRQTGLAQNAAFKDDLVRDAGVKDVAAGEQTARSLYAMGEMGASNPMMQKFYKEAGEGIDPHKRAGQAVADVEGAFKGRNQEMARNFARYGIDPNSGAFQKALKSVGLDKARAKAGAITGARERAYQENFGRLQTGMGARNLNSGVPGVGAGYGASGQQAPQAWMNLGTKTPTTNNMVGGPGIATPFSGVPGASGPSVGLPQGGAMINMPGAGSPMGMEPPGGYLPGQAPPGGGGMSRAAVMPGSMPSGIGIGTGMPSGPQSQGIPGGNFNAVRGSGLPMSTMGIPGVGQSPIGGSISSSAGAASALNAGSNYMPRGGTTTTNSNENPMGDILGAGLGYLMSGGF